MISLRSLCFLCFVLLWTACAETGVSVRELRSGDLLFVANAEGNRITEVTEGIEGLGIDHVAIVSEEKSGLAELTVIEAVPEGGVIQSPLDSFLVRLGAGESVLVGRISGLDAEASILRAKEYLGLPYDDLFMPGDSAVYCSELVQKSMVLEKTGEPVFGTVPMSFHDSTGRVTGFWTDFYAARGLSVPEGEPGTNPGEMSRDPRVKILGSLRK